MPTSLATPRRRLLVLFDGTWNEPYQMTNVYRFAASLADHDAHGCAQHWFYDAGVGTKATTRLSGGLLGVGLSENLQHGYDWLARHYQDGDQIFILGFSRGAYTARSLAGLLYKCGLLRVSTPDLLRRAEALYRSSDRATSPAAQAFRQYYSREVHIEFVGVWDTVGRLGIPSTYWSERGKYAFHDTALSPIVRHAYQALALDEHRAAYAPVFWTSENGEIPPAQCKVEQRWFVGSHSNVGGGYQAQHLCPEPWPDQLADYSLRWMQEKAQALGVALQLCQPHVEAYRRKPNDSYRQFLYGAYALWQSLRREGRFYRPYEQVMEHGHIRYAINVSIDESVKERMAWPDARYCPQTLVRAGKVLARAERNKKS